MVIKQENVSNLPTQNGEENTTCIYFRQDPMLRHKKKNWNKGRCHLIGYFEMEVDCPRREIAIRKMGLLDYIVVPASGMEETRKIELQIISVSWSRSSEKCSLVSFVYFLVF